jgi:hypothetical protein
MNLYAPHDGNMMPIASETICWNFMIYILTVNDRDKYKFNLYYWMFKRKIPRKFGFVAEI